MAIIHKFREDGEVLNLCFLLVPSVENLNKDVFISETDEFKSFYGGLYE